MSKKETSAESFCRLGWSNEYYVSIISPTIQ